MSKGNHGLKCLAIQICYAHMLQEQLQIMLPLANTDLGSSLGKNLSALVVNILLNQNAIFVMILILRVGYKNNSCIRETQENSIKIPLQSSLSYILLPIVHAHYCALYPK